MKKLLVAAMGIAAAYGAFADPFSVGKRFEDLTVDTTVTTNELNEAAGGTFWTDPVGATNTYTVKKMDAYGGSRPAFFPVAPTNALEVKTTFGSPLKFNFKEGDTQELGADGLYFDSLVKFTVCDDAPEDKDAYSGAKIMMWLQSDDDNAPTNVMIRAGYLTYSAGVVSSVATNYTCGTVDGDFAESWHRVTIKAIADITAEDGVPGFVVFIDREMVIVPLAANYNVWGDGFPARNDKAKYWENRKALFPSIVQSADKKLFSAVEFDGTGFLNDVTVTETAPDFAEDKVDETPEVSVTINGTPLVGTLKFANAVAAVNDADYGEAQNPSATITLSKDAVITEPVEFTANATITLDFAGFVLTNELADAAITNSATTLIITDSEGNGGIYCTDWENGALAIYNSNGKNIAIQDGVFYGGIECENWNAPGVEISGGAFTDGGVSELLVAGKALEEQGDLFVVVDAPEVVTYTVTIGTPTHATVVVATNTVTIGTAGGAYTVEAGSTVTVDYAAETGYELSGETSYEIENISAAAVIAAPSATAISYAITYTLKTETGTAPTDGSYTVETASPVALAQPVAVSGYTFSGWYDNAELTGDPVTSFTVDTAALAAKAFYGQFTKDEPEIDPSDPEPVEVEAEDGDKAIEAVVVPAPAGAGIDTPAKQAAYKDLFNYTATEKSTGVYEVTLTGIKEEKVAEVNEDAVESLVAAAQSEAPTVSVDVPAGLYYKVTTYNTLGGTAVDSETGLSDGAGTEAVNKPSSTTQGFIKVEMSTVPFN